MYIIPENSTKIAILTSGGVDSTLLLYLVAKQIHEQQLNVQVLTFSKNLIGPRLQSVFSYINQFYPVPILHNNTHGRVHIKTVVKSILDVTACDYVFSGCNRVVTDQFTTTVYIPNDTPPFRGDPYSHQHLRPFIEMDKIEIVRMFINFDILPLLMLTRSCGSTAAKMECGGCYFCQEKIWAMRNLNLISV
jgi:7-cyano-7-deazaguanine synthase in queuosine biosynthesis